MIVIMIIIIPNKVDPAMMAALMAACSIIQTGANTEEVNKIMMTMVMISNRGVRGWKNVCLFSLWRVRGLAYVTFSCLLRSCHVTQNNRVVLELGIRGQKNRSIWILQNYGLSRPWLTWYFCFNIQWRVKTNGTEKRRNLFLILRSVNFCPTKSWRQIGCDSCLILLQIKEKQTWALRHESQSWNCDHSKVGWA